MSRKRSVIPDIYKYKKRLCLAPSSGGGNASLEDGMDGSCSGMNDKLEFCLGTFIIN